MKTKFPPPTVSYAIGPDAIGIQQVARYTRRWAAWSGSFGVRIVATAGIITPPSDNIGEPCEVFTTTTASKLSFCFDQDSRPVVAIENGDTAIQVRRKQGEAPPVEFVYDFPGTSPCMFYNGLLRFYPGEADAVCIYLKPWVNARKLYCRFQREDFATEHELNTLHVDLVSTLETSAVGNQTEGRFQEMYLRDVRGNPVFLRSWQYPPWPVEVTEVAQQGTTHHEGEYLEAIISRDAGIDTGRQGVTFQDGAYIDALVIESLTEKALGIVTFKDGEYFNPVIERDAGIEKALASATFRDGEYTNVPDPVILRDGGTEKADQATTHHAGLYLLVVRDGGTYSEKASQQTSFRDGSYS